jgi:hypothetical protein
MFFMIGGFGWGGKARRASRAVARRGAALNAGFGLSKTRVFVGFLGVFRAPKGGTNPGLRRGGEGGLPFFSVCSGEFVGLVWQWRVFWMARSSRRAFCDRRARGVCPGTARRRLADSAVWRSVKAANLRLRFWHGAGGEIGAVEVKSFWISVCSDEKSCYPPIVLRLFGQ